MPNDALIVAKRGPSGEGSIFERVGAILGSRRQMDENLQRLSRLLAEAFLADCLFVVKEPANKLTRVQAWHSVQPERRRRLERMLLDDEAVSRLIGAVAGALVNARPVEAGSDAGVLGSGSLLAVPLAHGGAVLGALVLLRAPEAQILSVEALNLAEALALPIASAIVNERLLSQERWQRQKAELMLQASRAIHTELHFDQAIREIVLLLKQSIKVPWVGILELTPSDRTLSLLGSTAAIAADLRLGAQAFALSDWREAEAVLQTPENIELIPLTDALGPSTGKSAAFAWAFPLLNKHLPQGLLLLLPPLDEPELTSEAREVAVGLAEMVALAIANQHLIEQEAKARIQIIRSQAAAEEREMLLRQIVHDLRNATQAMSLVVEDMELSIADDNPELRTGLQTIDSQITFVTNFLKEKLSWFQRTDKGAIKDATALAAIFVELENRFGPAARAKHQRLVVSLPPAVQVPLTGVQLAQIIGNLLDNAIKYTQPLGEVRLWADVSDGWATLYVADNGPGITAIDRPRLGEIGYRGRLEQEGSGLGLANVRQMVTQAGGLFGVSGSEAQGTTFHVSLPTTTWGRITQ